MPATNPVSLPAIAFSKNRLQLILQSDDYLAALSEKSVNFLEITGAVAAGQQYILSWTGAQASMTAADVPDDSGLQFPAGDGSNDYVSVLVYWFTGNYFINRDFVVTTDFTGDHPRIIFTAKKADPDFDFTNTNDGATGVITGGVTDQPKENFLHHVQLWIANASGTDFDQCFMANNPLDFPATGQTTIDIHEALDAYLASDKPLLTDPFAFCVNSIRQFYFLYGQYYGTGDNAFVHRLTKSDLYFIAKGGLGKPQAILRDIVAELTTAGHTEQGRFLRQGSINKLVTTDQPEWLTWINLTGADQLINPEVKVYYDDMTDFTFNAVNGIDVPPYGKIQFQAGFTQLGIAAKQPGKTPIYYTVRINQAGNSLTAYYAFVIDYKFREWPRYIIYENSYGAFQTIGTVGKGLAEVDRTKDDAQMAVDPYVAAIDGEFLEVNIRIQDKYTVNIGYDRAGRRNTALLRDLMASQKIYLWKVLPAGEDLPGNEALVPVGLNTQNLKDAEDGVNVYASSLEFYPLYDDVVWTEDPALVTDDTVPDLLAIAGSPIPPILIPPPDGGGDGDGTGAVIPVESDDPHLGLDDGRQKYTAPALVGKSNYRIWTTQMGLYFRTEDITYNADEGSFLILIPAFVLTPGDQLLIFPYIINPDEI